MRLLIGLILAGLLACGVEGPPLQSRAAAITDGSEDLGHPAIGKLIFSLSGGTAQDGACTATLVGQRTVLSAAHCLIYANTELELDDGQRFAASRTVVHPIYDASRPYHNDLGLALLAEAPAVRPLALDLRQPRPGTAITLVGYGRSAAALSDQGLKRLAQNTIASVEPDYLTIVGSGDGLGNACHGDSGGPLLLELDGEEALVGLLSYIIDYSTCGTTTYATRLDLFGEWLQTEAAGDLLLVDATTGDGGCHLAAASLPEGSSLALLLFLLGGMLFSSLTSRHGSRKCLEGFAGPPDRDRSPEEGAARDQARASRR